VGLCGRDAALGRRGAGCGSCSCAAFSNTRIFAKILADNARGFGFAGAPSCCCFCCCCGSGFFNAFSHSSLRAEFNFGGFCLLLLGFGTGGAGAAGSTVSVVEAELERGESEAVSTSRGALGSTTGFGFAAAGGSQGGTSTCWGSLAAPGIGSGSSGAAVAARSAAISAKAAAISASAADAASAATARSVPRPRRRHLSQTSSLIGEEPLLGEEPGELSVLQDETCTSHCCFMSNKRVSNLRPELVKEVVHGWRLNCHDKSASCGN